MLKKSTIREIRGSLGRYIAILAIVALGVGFFSGLKVTREAMVKTTDAYLQSNSFFDYQVISTLGFEKSDVNSLAKEADVAQAEGSISADVLYHTDSASSDKVIKIHSLPSEINTLTLENGRMPKKANECVIDYRMFEDPIGKTIIVSENNEKDTRDMLKYKKYTVTGTVVSPIYLNFERGTTSLGDGSVSGFAYIGENGFDVDYYTEIFLKLKESYPIYSDEYDDLLDSTKDDIQTAVDARADRRYKEIIKDAKKELAKGQRKYDKNYAKYKAEKADAMAELSDNYEKLCEAQNTIYTNRNDLENKQKELQDALPKAEAGLAEINVQRQQLEAQKPYMTPEQIAIAEAQLNGAETEVKAQIAQINTGLAQIAGGFDRLKDAQKTLDGNVAKYRDGKAEAERKFAKAEREFADARKELRDAKREIDDIETPDTYVLDRYTNVGYACFENDSNIVDGIAKVFPIFFFLVAALVCMTTMTRMVDEQRTQIGVLKALGYSNGAVMGKYMFYAGSAAFLGCLIGFFSCCYIFPQVIWKAYGMMYDFSGNLFYIINKPLAAISLAVSLLCSMGATLVSCYAEFREVPAQLIRPKAPKSGKRILLERIPFIWNRLGFLYKVSFRNIFRYKKRFFMMVLGICGCTALLLTGLGVRDSVKNVVDYQFDEIQVYDYSVVFSKNMNESRQKAFMEKAAPYTEDILFTHQSSADLVKGQKTKSITMIASDFNGYEEYVNLYDRKKEPISFPDDGQAVICSKLARTFNLEVGSTITLRDENMKEMTLKVSGICENYVGNYVYVQSSDVAKQWGYEPEIKTALIHSAKVFNDDGEEINPRSEEAITKVHQSAAKVQKLTNVTTVSVNNDMRQRVGNMMKSLDYVIALVVLSAGALAFIVLYNLTNINITERIREIATIKVLGFYPLETSEYVFRENFFLTAISAVVGLFAGKVLHAFVMSQIQVDMINFDVRISTFSYILAVILTFVFAMIVNFAMYFKLQKISMTESLKSIE